MRKLSLLLFLFLLPACLLSAKPMLEASLDEIDLGIVPQNCDFCREIVLRSTGDASVIITEVNTFCHCIELPLEKKVIPPGDSLVVRLKFNSSSYVGNREWRPHIYCNTPGKYVRIGVKAFILAGVLKHEPIYVHPHTVNASQFGSVVTAEFPINLVNVSEEYVPLELIYSDEEYFKLDFPVFIEPNSTAVGSITLNEKGLANEFETYLTFEYIDKFSEKKLYSVPIKRKIYKPKE